LTIIGIDNKYSTGTMEWIVYGNPHLLQNKEFETTAEIIEIQQEEELFSMDWYDPTCYAT
jgi:hypothetical protein